MKNTEGSTPRHMTRRNPASVVLWWGRYDPAYSRNRLVLRLFEESGWDICSFRPVASQLGTLEAYLRALEKPDIIWVPCFRHRDVASAARWAGKWRVPLVLDLLISSYEKEVMERKKWPENSLKARRKLHREISIFFRGDVVVADTSAHARFFHDVLKVPEDRLEVLYVGAEEDMFMEMPAPPPEPPFEILFYGSFLELHGTDVIVKAAAMTQDLEARWILLGDGPARQKTQRMAAEMKNVFFEPWIDYKSLPGRLAQAHILLGVLGPTVLTSLVIPNKMYQSMAVGRPVITSHSGAYRDNLQGSDVIGWIPAGDSAALAETVRSWLADPGGLAMRGKQTRRLFDRFFSEKTLRKMLASILEKAAAGSRIRR